MYVPRGIWVVQKAGYAMGVSTIHVHLVLFSYANIWIDFGGPFSSEDTRWFPCSNWGHFTWWSWVRHRIFPDVFIRVSHYIDWVQESTGNAATLVEWKSINNVAISADTGNRRYGWFRQQWWWGYAEKFVVWSSRFYNRTRLRLSPCSYFYRFYVVY